jgi:hypothetical protein
MKAEEDVAIKLQAFSSSCRCSLTSVQIAPVAPCREGLAQAYRLSDSGGRYGKQNIILLLGFVVHPIV